MGLFNRIRNGISAFRGGNHLHPGRSDPGYSYNVAYTGHMYTTNSVLNMIYNKIAITCANMSIEHVRILENGNQERMDTQLEKIFRVSANLDQSGNEFKYEIVKLLLHENVIAIFPSYYETNSPEQYTKMGTITSIREMRTGKIVEWYSKHVLINAYNIDTGNYEDIVLEKSAVAIVENPLNHLTHNNYALQRLLKKLQIAEAADDGMLSKKINFFLKTNFPVKTDIGKKQAQERLDTIAQQAGSNPYGGAYIEPSEDITFTPREIINDSDSVIYGYVRDIYAQFGISEKVMNGTANEFERRSFISDCIEPIMNAIINELDRKFITDTARTQGQRLILSYDPFKIATLSDMAQAADIFSRNGIMSPNEIRSRIGMQPVEDDDADALYNRNMPVEDRTQLEYEEEYE